jgi:hypothetical protein
MIKDMENHACLKRRRISGDEEDFARIPCEFCGVQVRLDELANHQSTCTADSEDVEITYDSANVTSRGYDGVETTDGCHSSDYTSIYALPCEICNELYPSDKLEEHQLECGVQNDVDDNNDDDIVEETSGDEVSLPCEFCEELFPDDKLYDHQLECLQRPDGDDYDNGYVGIPHFHIHRRGPSVFVSNDPFDMTTFNPFLTLSLLQ